MIDIALRSFIIALNTGAGDRVFVGNAAPGAARPLVVIRRSGGSQPRTLSGQALFERTQFGVDVLTSDYAAAYPIALAIRQALDGFGGALGTTTVHSCRCVQFPIDQSAVEGDLIIRWVAMEFLFVHSEG